MGSLPGDERPILVHAPEDGLPGPPTIIFWAPGELFSRSPLPAPRSFMV